MVPMVASTNTSFSRSIFPRIHYVTQFQVSDYCYRPTVCTRWTIFLSVKTKSIDPMVIGIWSWYDCLLLGFAHVVLTYLISLPVLVFDLTVLWLITSTCLFVMLKLLTICFTCLLLSLGLTMWSTCLITLWSVFLLLKFVLIDYLLGVQLKRGTVFGSFFSENPDFLIWSLEIWFIIDI